MKRIGLVLIAISTFLLIQCEIYREGCMDPNASNYSVAADIDDGSCEYNIDPNNLNCHSASVGNLTVVNETNDLLYLYKSVNDVSEYISCIPANADTFLINVPIEQQNSIINLQVWKAEVVQNSESPNIDKVYRQWSVPLSSSNNIDEHANWVITDSDVNSSSGTLSLSYPDFDADNNEVIYHVDVFLNSKNGSRLASLQPGVSNKKVSIDYGIHILYFRYWYSNPNSPSSEIEEIGWSQINGIVVNTEHEISDIEIPVFSSSIGRYGYIKIYNETSDNISIYAGDRLIEKIAQVSGSAEGLSIVPANKSTTFLIPEDSYAITAKSADGSTTIVTFKGVSIENEMAELRVGITHKTVSIENNTSERLLLHSIDGTYLGKVFEAGASSSSFLVDSDFDSLLVISSDKTQGKKVPATTGVTISNLDDYNSQDIKITNPWTVIDSNHYQSPDISDDETTTMSATLQNTSTVLLTFEYKVSSEIDYDKFSFSIDGTNEISNESGDTNWKNYSVNVSPGSHTLNWTYQKDDNISIDADNVEIRNITVK